MGSSSSHTHSHTKNKTKNNKNCVHIRKASDSMRSDGDIHYNFVMSYISHLLNLKELPTFNQRCCCLAFNTTTITLALYNSMDYIRQTHSQHVLLDAVRIFDPFNNFVLFTCSVILLEVCQFIKRGVLGTQRLMIYIVSVLPRPNACGFTQCPNHIYRYLWI